jgi:predicted nucleotidyltransferase
MGIRVARLVLYGSHARGTADEDSDIDLLIVSPDFSRMNLRERLELLGLAAARLWQPVQGYPCTPEELEQVDSATFLEEVLETGVVLA